MPQTPLRLQGLIGVEEGTYGTDATPAATNGIRGRGVLFTDAGLESVFPNRREDVYSNSLVKAVPGQPKGRVATIDLTVPLKGAGAAYSSSTPVRPEIDPLLRCCGLSRTHVDTGSSESVSYALADSGHVGATLYAYAGNKLFRLIGCRGNAVWTVEAGMLGRIRFQIQGMIVTAPTEIAVPSITYSSVIEPAAVAMSLSLDPGTPWSPEAPGFELDLGNEIVRLDDVNGADGLEGFFIPSRAPVFRFTPRTVALSAYNPYALFRSATAHSIDATLGSTQYNRVDLEIAAAYLSAEPGHDADGGFPAWSPEYELQDLIIRFD
jgi:hypothetical protein